MTTTLTVFEGWDLDVSDADEPRARDVDIAKRAGLADPHSVRRIIEKNWDELTRYDEIRVSDHDRKSAKGRPSAEYWLTEDQASHLMLFLRTPKARELRLVMVRVFSAYRRGQLAAAPAPLALDIAHGIRLRDEPRLKSEMQALCGMTARSTARTLAAVYGWVRRTYRVGSPFDVAAAAWPVLQQTLQAIALGKLLLPGKAARVLRLVAKIPETLPLFPEEA